MRDLLQEKETETLVFVRYDSLNAKIYFSCDSANKIGAHHMIKCISFYDTKKDKLFTYELDSDFCVVTN